MLSSQVPSSVSFSSTLSGLCVSQCVCVCKGLQRNSQFKVKCHSKVSFFSSDLHFDKGSVIIYIYSKVSLLSQFNSGVLKGQFNQKLNDFAS